ncbi:MAG: RHS repeat-associated core domain-containing protein [Lachnospiraceae bacterium]|nr:RHS repeat-associated core domain-containing protein [Lachnospiraceae bacterium]
MYDGEGKRISKTENGVTTNYYYEGGMLLYTTDEADSRTSLNITGTESNVIAGVRYDDGESVYFYGKDIKGSTSCITDANADVVVSYLYDDWGNTTINGDTTFYNQICYTGGVYDELTKLYYLNARYYNPETGVFMSQDSVRGSADDYGTWNLYAYCAGNPVCYVDPSGHNPIALAGGGLFITAAVSILGAAIIVGGVCYLDSKLDNPSKREEMIDQVIQEYEKTSKKEEASKTSKKNTKNQKKTGNNKSPKKNNKITSKISDELDMKKISNHVFSKEHMKDGIMRLGKSKEKILNKFFEIALATSKQWREGSNEIRTFIKGIRVTVRIYVSNGKMINLDGFVGYSGRVVGKLIRYTKK